MYYLFRLILVLNFAVLITLPFVCPWALHHTLLVHMGDIFQDHLEVLLGVLNVTKISRDFMVFN